MVAWRTLPFGLTERELEETCNPVDRQCHIDQPRKTGASVTQRQANDKLGHDEPVPGRALLVICWID
jgi:hypothetical protein